MFVTITEKWDYDHGNDRRLLIHKKLNEMELTGKFVRVKFGGLTIADQYTILMALQLKLLII